MTDSQKLRMLSLLAAIDARKLARTLRDQGYASHASLARSFVRNHLNSKARGF